MRPSAIAMSPCERRRAGAVADLRAANDEVVHGHSWRSPMHAERGFASPWARVRPSCLRRAPPHRNRCAPRSWERGEHPRRGEAVNAEPGGAAPRALRPGPQDVHARARGGPRRGVGVREQHDRRCADQSREMADAGIVAEVAMGPSDDRGHARERLAGDDDVCGNAACRARARRGPTPRRRGGRRAASRARRRSMPSQFLAVPPLPGCTTRTSSPSA